MSTAKDERLTDSARRIADGQAVNWDQERSGEPALDHELAALSRVERVASAWRALGGWAPDDDDPTAARDVLFRWGELEAIEKLGEGAFGEVWRAWDPQLEREVALKLRRAEVAGADEASARRELDEARQLARVRHPNVLTVHAVDVRDGRAGLVLEFVRGATLEALLAERGTFGAEECRLVALSMVRALAAVHAAGLVHGDVKAANVMREHGGRLVLMDFGSAHAAALGGAGGRTGTPLAAAPETLRGERATPASDLYSLGVLLFRLATGTYPVMATSLDELRRKHERGERTPLRSLRAEWPTPFVQAVERALEPDPARRFRDAAAMEAALAGEPERADVVAAPPPARVRRSPALAWLAAAVLGAVALVAMWRGGAWMRGPQSNAPATSGPVAHAPVVEPAVPARDGATATHPAGVASPAPASVALEVEATLFRTRDGFREPVDTGARIAPGDQLSLEMSGGESLHVYVLDEDEQGETFTLFPVAGGEVGNPLARGRHVLPGTRDGVPFDWVVTSAGGREHVLIVASRRPVAALEKAVAAMPAAATDRPVAYAKVPEEAWAGLRGIGGMAASSVRPAGESRLEALARDLASRRDAGVWVRHLSLRN